ERLDGEPGALVLGDALPPADERVLPELVLAAATPPDAQDDQLALPRRQGALVQHVSAEHEPPLQQLRVVREHPEDVEPPERVERRARLVVPVLLGGGRQPSTARHVTLLCDRPECWHSTRGRR